MKDQLISFETAKLLKEKGFDIPCIYGYVSTENTISKVGELKNCFSWEEYGDTRPYDWNNKICKHYQLVSAPTQSLLQRWLREKHLFCVEVTIVNWHNLDKHAYTPFVRGIQPKQKDMMFQNYDTYEQALEMGLKQALKLIE